MSLVVKNLEVSVGTFTLRIPSLEIPKGSICGVTGKSGSGKSTLLAAIAGFLPLTQGEIHFDGKRLDPLPPEDRRVAIVFQDPYLFPHLSVFENVAFGVRLFKRKDEVNGIVGTWLKKLEIESLRDRMPDQISGGQAQRVALARAFAVGFPVILLDEPFAGLDSGLRDSVRVLVRRLCRELAVTAIVVSHDPEDIATLSDQVFKI